MPNASQLALITFDLEKASAEERVAGYAKLKQHGLSRYEGVPHIALPETSVMGITDLGETAQKIHDEVKKLLNDITKGKVQRLCVVLVADVASSDEKEQQNTGNLVERYAAALRIAAAKRGA